MSIYRIILKNESNPPFIHEFELNTNPVKILAIKRILEEVDADINPIIEIDKYNAQFIVEDFKTHKNNYPEIGDDYYYGDIEKKIENDWIRINDWEFCEECLINQITVRMGNNKSLFFSSYAETWLPYFTYSTRQEIFEDLIKKNQIIVDFIDEDSGYVSLNNN